MLDPAPGLERSSGSGAGATLAGEPATALSYNLPVAPSPNEANADYAARLRC